jgi:hypothetical protein
MSVTHVTPEKASFRARQSARMNLEVSPRSLFAISSFGMNVSMMLVVLRFATRSFSALAMFKVTDFPVIVQVARIVPVGTH